MSTAALFRDNLRARLALTKKRHGETLHDFCRRVLGPGESEYKWLRKVCSEGSPYKREGTKNHERLMKLHEGLGVAWPSLWSDGKTAQSLVGRLWQILETSDKAEIESALQSLIEQFERRQDARRLIAQFARERADLYGVLGTYELEPWAVNMLSHKSFQHTMKLLIEFGIEVHAEQAQSPPAAHADTAEAAAVAEPNPVPDADEASASDDDRTAIDAVLLQGMRQFTVEGRSLWEDYLLEFTDEQEARTAISAAWRKKVSEGQQLSPSFFAKEFWTEWQR